MSSPQAIRTPLASPGIEDDDERMRTLSAAELDAIRANFSQSPPSGLEIPKRDHDSGKATPEQASSYHDPSPLSKRVVSNPTDANGHSESATPMSVEELSDRQKARIVRRHLVQKGDNSEAVSINEDSGAVDESESSYHGLLGGDAVHDLYKWQQQQQTRPMRKPRSESFTEGIRSRRASIDPADDPMMDISSIRQPGGFRRNYIHRRAAEEGQDIPEQRFTRNFVDFLTLYGHYAGEELDEIDEEDEDEEEDVESRPKRPNERTPLVRQQSKRRQREEGETGDATVTQAVMMLLKSFVGTGILFLGKAFFNGGILFSAIVLISIALISLYSFLLLVETRLTIHGSFGDMGGILYGRWMRRAILFSIVLSQIGFVSAYTIFVAQNMQAFVLAVTDCKRYVPTSVMMACELVVLLPFAMVRRIQKLSSTALVADAFILLGIIYIFGNEIAAINTRGLADVALFNSRNYPLLVGTAVFSFEGIGLVIPVTEAMKEPHKFPKVLSGVMIVVMLLFAGAGVLAYAAYGSDIQTVVIVNLPQDNRFVNVVQVLYSIAIGLSIPLQFYPAVQILEQKSFGRKSGKKDAKIKWEKNAFRAAILAACCLLAWAGAADLDKFVSLVGSFACVPLCFCYPALLHFKVAKKRSQKIADIVLFVFGLCAMLFTTVSTIGMLLEGGGSSGPPQMGRCTPPA